MAIATDTVSGDRDRISGSVKRDRKETAHPPATVSMGNRQSGVGLTGRGEAKTAPPAHVSASHRERFPCSDSSQPLPPGCYATPSIFSISPGVDPRISILRGMPSRKNPGHPGSGWARRFAAKLPPRILPCRDLSNQEAGYWFDALISAAVILGKNILLL